MMKARPADGIQLDGERLTREVLDLLADERRREMMICRLGLFGQRETLAAIASSIGVTRQAVQWIVAHDSQRLSRLRNESTLRAITRQVEKSLVRELRRLGGAARASDLARLLGPEQGAAPESRVAFLAAFCPSLAVIAADRKHYLAVGLSGVIDKQSVDALIRKIADVLAHAGVPLESAALATQIAHEDDTHIATVAHLSKDLRQVGDLWGLAIWPTMDTRYIRGRIYALLKRHGSRMHFMAILEAVNANASGHVLSRSGVLNELSRDPAFVRVGQGVYALADDGYEELSGPDLIAKILHEAHGPLPILEIVARVYEVSPYLKEISIRQYLGLPQFRRVEQGVYELAEAAGGDTAPRRTQ